jgi:hypothetical protein
LDESFDHTIMAHWLRKHVPAERIGHRVNSEEVDTRIWLLTHEDLRHMGRVRAFLDFMAAALVGERDLLEGRRGR